MILHWSPRSPFVRKVLVFAHETGLAERFTCKRTVVASTKPNAELLPVNPLSKLPTIELDDGSPLYDSMVICEYLDGLHAGRKLFPPEGTARFTALRRSALGDGILDFLLLWRNERDRAQPSQVHLDAYAVKYVASLNALETEADAIAATPFDVGHICIGCALAYLDFRFADLDWRSGHPKIAAWHATHAQRPSMRATEPAEG